MRIQGRQSRIFRQAYSLDTWWQGAPMYVVSWHAYLKSSHGKEHLIFTWHGQVTKFKEPPISMCIYCGKTNTNKEEVDKYIMCHTRGKNNLVVTIVKRHLHSSIRHSLRLNAGVADTASQIFFWLWRQNQCLYSDILKVDFFARSKLNFSNFAQEKVE